MAAHRLRAAAALFDCFQPVGDVLSFEPVQQQLLPRQFFRSLALLFSSLRFAALNRFVTYECMAGAILTDAGSFLVRILHAGVPCVHIREGKTSLACCGSCDIDENSRLHP